MSLAAFPTNYDRIDTHCIVYISASQLLPRCILLIPRYKSALLTNVRHVPVIFSSLFFSPIEVHLSFGSQSVNV